jgi:hypothetical protein
VQRTEFELSDLVGSRSPHWLGSEKQRSAGRSQRTMITPNFSGKPTYAATDAVTELLRIRGKVPNRCRSRCGGERAQKHLQGRGGQWIPAGAINHESEVKVPRIRSRDRNGSVNFSSKLITAQSTKIQGNQCPRLKAFTHAAGRPEGTSVGQDHRG